MKDLVNSYLERLPRRRIERAIASRVAALSGKLSDRLDRDRLLTCNACGHAVAGFTRYAGKPNLCPRCGATAKERLVLALIDSGHLTIPSGGRFLHIGPSERTLIQRLVAAGSYTAADLHPGVYEGQDVVELDLTKLGSLGSDLGKFDIIYASHILEHIPDDGLALRATCGSLTPQGEFWMLVPLAESSTVDGDGTESVRQREERFGQWDHVRQYGFDVEQRLEAAGYTVTRLGAVDLGVEIVASAGLSLNDIVWRCTSNAGHVRDAR